MNKWNPLNWWQVIKENNYLTNKWIDRCIANGKCKAYFNYGDYTEMCNGHPGVIVNISYECFYWGAQVRIDYGILDLVTGHIGSCSQEHCLKDFKFDPLTAIRIADEFRINGFCSGSQMAYMAKSAIVASDITPEMFEQNLNWNKNFIKTWRENDEYEGRIPGRMECRPKPPQPLEQAGDLTT